MLPLARPHRRVVPTDIDLLDVDRPSLADLSRECSRARLKGDLHRAYWLRVAIIARVFRAQRAAFREQS
jgi:hypothetical protein